MLTSENKKRNQIQIFCIDDLVPQDHMLRKIEKAIEWSFIYDLVKDRYSEEKEAGGQENRPLVPRSLVPLQSKKLLKILSALGIAEESRTHNARQGCFCV